MLRKSKTLLEANRAAGRLFQPGARVPGSILSFVPGHGGSKAVAEDLSRILAEALGIAALLADFDSGEAPQRLDARTWGALVSEVDGLGVLGARQVHPRQVGQLLEYARDYYAVVCADLTHARESHALEVLRVSGGIFLVANSDHSSLQGVREKIAWLRSMDLDDRCGLLLARDPKGVSPREAEDLTGVPVCSLIDTGEQLAQLAMWLASANKAGATGQVCEYALAV